MKELISYAESIHKNVYLCDARLLDIQEILNRFAGNLVDVLCPDPSWPDAKCGECGYCDPTITTPFKFNCLRTGAELPTAHDRACPAFVRRPEKAEEESNED